MQEISFSENIPVKGHYDVIVAGGGVAGIAAALAVRRRGKSVLLIEKSTLLGGLATIGLVNLFVPMCNGRGKQIIRGMADELLRLSIRYGYDTIPEPWKNGEPQELTGARLLSEFSPNIFALAVLELLHQEGVAVRFDSIVCGSQMENGRCIGVLVESKSGREFFGGEIFIDTTGDADLLFRSGVPTIQGKNYFTMSSKVITMEGCKQALETGDIKHAFSLGFGGASSLYGHNHPEGMKFYTGTDADEISEYLILNQLEMLKSIKEQPRKSRDIATMPTMAQFRTTRCIHGDYILKTDDAYRHFDDSVGAICDFDRRDFLYEIPYRVLLHSDYPNILTAGRSASAEGYAWDVLRVIPPAIISGQAAGTAAVLAIETQRPVSAVNIAELQKQLAEDNVMIHFDDSLVPKEADTHSGSGNDSHF